MHFETRCDLIENSFEVKEIIASEYTVPTCPVYPPPQQDELTIASNMVKKCVLFVGFVIINGTTLFPFQVHLHFSH